MAETADAPGLGPGPFGGEGSSPSARTGFIVSTFAVHGSACPVGSLRDCSPFARSRSALVFSAIRRGPSFNRATINVVVTTLQILNGDDWELWRGVRLRALAEDPDSFLSVLADWQGAGDNEVEWRSRLDDVAFNVVAMMEDVPVGQVSGHRPDTSNSGEVISLWVDPSARGTGVGESLLAAVEQWARNQELAELTLSVRSHNVSAIRLYERSGYRDVGASKEIGCDRQMVRRLEG